MEKEIHVKDGRRHSFFITYNDLIDEYGPRIGLGGIGVYSVLCRFMNNETKRCYPSYETIGRLTQSSTKTIGKYIDRLEAVGLIKIVKWKTGSVKQYEILHHATDVNFTAVQVQPKKQKLSTTDVKSSGDRRKFFPSTDVNFTYEQDLYNKTKKQEDFSHENGEDKTEHNKRILDEMRKDLVKKKVLK